jgi:hypothetical protein
MAAVTPSAAAAGLEHLPDQDTFFELAAQGQHLDARPGVEVRGGDRRPGSAALPRATPAAGQATEDRP